MNIVYKIDMSKQSDILAHLGSCSVDFITSLNKKVIIEEYSKKLYANAMKFEAWDDYALVGLAAIYINEKNFAYLTNISVTESYNGKRIGSELLRQCIVFATEQKIGKIRLEVEKQNIAAIKLYEKYNFEVSEINLTTQFMELKLQSMRQHDQME